jgi:dolichol-phosphate mannosyltransferase
MEPVEHEIAPSFSIVVPTLDEAENVDELLRQIFALEHVPPFEVIIVDDDSRDGTAERARAWSPRHAVSVIVRRGERGLSRAVIAGARAARADVVLVMDADLSHPVSAIPALVRPLLAGSAGIAIGSRHVRGGSTRGWPLRRKLASRAAAALAWPISPVSDPMSGFFAARRADIVALDHAPGGFKILLELLARGGSSLRAVETPIEFVDRTRGESKLGASQVGEYLRRLAALAGADLGSARLRRLWLALCAGAVLDFAIFALLEGRGAVLAGAHLASGALAALAVFSLCARDLRAEKAVRFAALSLLALLLRGGALASLVRNSGISPLVAFVPSALVGLSVTALGAAFFVFAPARGPNERALALRLGCIAVALYLFALRIAYAGAVELLPEEAYYWSYAQHLDLSYLDHPPLVAWLISAGTALLGQSEWSVRAGAIACSALTAAFSAALAARWLGKTAAAATLALVAALPFGFATGVLMTPDAPLAAAWSGALFFLWLALVELRPRAWWGVGACIGLGLLAKYTIALLGAGALAFALVDRRARSQLFRPEPYLAAALALAIFSPVLVWNYRHDWASFAFQSSRRLSDPPAFGLHRLMASVVVLLGPVVVAALLALLRGQTRRAVDAETPSDESARRFRFAGCAAFAPLAVFALFSVAHVPKMNWTGPLWFALLPATAALLAGAPAAHRGRLASTAATLFVPSLWLALFCYGAALHALALGVPGTDFPGGTRYAQRWQNIAAAVDRAANDVRAETGAQPVIVAFDRYATSSLLAFYQPASGPRWTIGGRQLFGAGTSLMYGYWTPPESIVGRTLLCVSDDPGDLERPVRFARAAGAIGSAPIAGQSDGARVFYRALYGYVPGAVSGTNRKNAAPSRTALSGASNSHMLPSSRMPSAARWSRPSSSGFAGFALPSDSMSLDAHSGRCSPFVSNTMARQSGPSLNTQSSPAPRSSGEAIENIVARPRTPSSSSSKSPSTSG